VRGENSAAPRNFGDNVPS